MHSSHARPRRLRPAGGKRGFTLLEVLLSIAIIALVATVLVGGTARLLDEQPVSADDILWKAVREARKTALKSERDVRLRFDKEKKQFVLLAAEAPAVLAADGFTKEEAPLQVFALVAPAAADTTVEFLGAGTKGGNAILVGGMLLEAETLKHVTFYADGTCTAFRAQIARNGGVHVLAIDPWTCAPVLPPVDPNAPPT